MKTLERFFVIVYNIFASKISQKKKTTKEDVHMTDKKLDLISNRCKTLLYCKKFPHILDTENRAYAYERVLEDFRADLKDEFGNEKDELTALNFIDELVVNDVDVIAELYDVAEKTLDGYAQSLS
mgnify:FL=1